MKKLTLTVIFFFTITITSWSHPHLFIDVQLDFVISDQGIDGIRHHWTLLKSFSSNIIEKYDRDKDGTFNKSEKNSIYNEVFKNTLKYYYYTYIEIDGIEYVAQRINNFDPVIDSGKVIYNFTIPCRIQAEKVQKNIEIAVLDKTGYISFALRYVKDPWNENIDYDIRIIIDSSNYSHSNSLGQGVLTLELIKSEKGEKNIPIDQNYKIYLSKYNRCRPIPSKTETNPFCSKGIILKKGDSPNPFLRK